MISIDATDADEPQSIHNEYRLNIHFLIYYEFGLFWYIDFFFKLDNIF